MWDQGIIKAGKVQPLDTTKCHFQLFALSQMIPFTSKISPKKEIKYIFYSCGNFPGSWGWNPSALLGERGNERKEEGN